MYKIQSTGASTNQPSIIHSLSQNSIIRYIPEYIRWKSFPDNSDLNVPLIAA